MLIYISGITHEVLLCLIDGGEMDTGQLVSLTHLASMNKMLQCRSERKA